MKQIMIGIFVSCTVWHR